MHSGTGSTARPVLGSPIRTPSDHGSLANSPRIIAGCYVLLRLLVPRHPPCALHELHTTKYFRPKNKDARVHCTVLEQPPHDRRHHPPAPTASPPRSRRRTGTGDRWSRTRDPPSRALPQDPTACQDPHHPVQDRDGEEDGRRSTQGRPAHGRRSQRPSQGLDHQARSPPRTAGRLAAGGRGSLERR